MPGVVGTLRVRVIDGRLEKGSGLLNLDTPDPYVKFSVANRSGKTIENRSTAKSNTYSPVWDETFFVKSVPTGNTLTVQCWDKDTFTSDDLIGGAPVVISQALGNATIATINVDIQKGGSRGNVRLEIEHIPQGSVDVTVVRAEGLYCAKEIPDPYVKIKYGSIKHKTKKINNNASPQWNERFAMGQFDLQDIKKGVFVTDIIKFEVMDQDRFSSDDSLGKAEFELLSLATKPSQDVRLPLTGKDSSGALYLKVVLTPETC